MEEEFDELTANQKEFVRVIELVHPSRLIDANLRCSGMGLSYEWVGKACAHAGKGNYLFADWHVVENR